MAAHEESYVTTEQSMFTIVTWHNIVIVVKYAALAGLGGVKMYVHSATQTKRILGHLVKFCNCY